MHLDKANGWLSLIANVGVLLGIIVIAVELQQTQISMLAEASTTRAQLATQIYEIQKENGIPELQQKNQQGIELSPEEYSRALQWVLTALRYFENLHYQMQAGVLDDEIWEGTLRNIDGYCDSEFNRNTFEYEFGTEGTLAALRLSLIHI